MSEVKTSPLLGTDANGDPTYTFTSAHTFGDVARWIVSEGGAEDVAFMLSEAALTRATPDPRDEVIKGLVEAATDAAEAIDMAYGSDDDESPHRHSAKLRAALAAAKAVQHD